MAETYIHQLAMQNAAWLSARQAVIASNVANANTPGFRSLDIKPFAEALEQTALFPSVSHKQHMIEAGAQTAAFRTVPEDAWETFHSGGNVSLEQEMIKATEVSSAYRLNTSIMRSFHGMFLVVAGG